MSMLGYPPGENRNSPDPSMMAQPVGGAAVSDQPAFNQLIDGVNELNARIANVNRSLEEDLMRIFADAPQRDDDLTDQPPIAGTLQGLTESIQALFRNVSTLERNARRFGDL